MKVIIEHIAVFFFILFAWRPQSLEMDDNDN